MSETVNELPGFDERFFQEANHIIESVPIEQRESKAYEIVCLQRNCRERQLAAEQEKVRVLEIQQRDLVMIVHRLCRKLPVVDKARVSAIDYLFRKGIHGSILRSADVDAALASTEDQQAQQDAKL